MSKKELFLYKIFCQFQGITLGNQRKGIHFLRTVESKKRGTWTWRKDSYEWEFAELYYSIEKHDLLER